MKLWQKKHRLNKEIEKFTVGNDFELDSKLFKYEIAVCIAHAKMLHKIKILTKPELSKLMSELKQIEKLHVKGNFEIKQSDEDAHTAIENHLTKKLGSLGKKTNTGRSRNEIVTAIRLYEKESLKEIIKQVYSFQNTLKQVIKENGDIQLPGYTHMQKAMPSSIKLWLGSYIDSSKDTIQLLKTVLKQIDQNPLGSAAGFGVPKIPINRSMTTKELGFKKIMKNTLYAQLSRGKFETLIVSSLTQVLYDLNRLATDLMLFSMKELGFVSIPKEFCTGSSIMPQKHNPDVLELVRAKYHIVIGEQMKLQGIMSNLMSGYNRDGQLTKEPLMSSIETTMSCISIMTLLLKKLKINKKNCKEALTSELYATEKANTLVMKGIPFRDAYKKIAKEYD